MGQCLNNVQSVSQHEHTLELGPAQLWVDPRGVSGHAHVSEQTSVAATTLNVDKYMTVAAEVQ